LINGVVFFSVVLIVWILAALWAGTSLGANFPFLTDLRTQLLADYGPDFLGSTLKSLRLTILGEISSDSDISLEIISDLSLNDLVPTATFAPGITGPTEPPTATQDLDPEATETPITATATNTPTLEATVTKTLSPTETEHPTKTPRPTEEIKALIPKLECVTDNHDGSYTAHFGYKNPNSFPIDLGIGPENYFSPDPQDQGQPITFSPGRSPDYPNASFRVVFDEEKIHWHLDGSKVTASASSSPCEPEETPEPLEDTQPPVLSGGVLSPPSVPLTSCTHVIYIDNLKVTDPSPSSGLSWVKLKYDIAGYTGYIFSDPLTLVSGGTNGKGGWDGIYSGSVIISIDSSWVSPEPDPFIINVWSKALDNAGYEAYLWHAEYTMPASCGVSN
jgi:hypothetical protein